MLITQQLTKAFTLPFSREISRDLACRYICEDLGASSVSMLIYSGLKDDLVCKGRYIKPNTIVSTPPDEILDFILKNISICEFIYSKEEKVKERKEDLSKLLAEYNDFFDKSPIQEIQFNTVYNTRQEWYDKYQQLKNTFTEERYGLNEDKLSNDYYDNSISGAYYKYLLQQDAEAAVSNKIINLHTDVSEDKKKCEKLLMQNLDVIIQDFDYYVAVPLKMNKRYFGLLRLIFPKKTRHFQIDSNPLKLVEKIAKKIDELTQMVVLNYQNFYYYHGYRQYAFYATQHNLTKHEELSSYLSKHCNELSALINCKGAIIRMWNEQKKDSIIVASSKGIIEYTKNSTISSAKFSRTVSRNFTERKDILAVHLLNCLKSPTPACEYKAFKQNGLIEKETTEWEIGDLEENIGYINILKNSNINSAVVIRIQPLKNSFLVLFNTQNRLFTAQDIEMVYVASKKIGLEIQNQQLNADELMQYMQNMAHQVISPLNALINHGRNLTLGAVPKNKVNNKIIYMSLLAKIAASHARSFAQLLDLANDRTILKKEKLFDLRLYLIEKAIDFQPLAQKKGISIHVRDAHTDNKIKIAIDKRVFSHAIFNLLDNAVKYSFNKWQRVKAGFSKEVIASTAKENISISVREVAEGVQIQISNCGLPIPTDAKNKIFEREFRAKEAFEFAPTGSGIGLFLTQKVIELHKGHIELLPSRNKHLIIFQITLPKE